MTARMRLVCSFGGGGGGAAGFASARAPQMRPEAGTVAALFVQANGCYAGLEGVDLWPASRDARLYAGPWPVVAHPPCERWGAMAKGGPRRDGGRAKELGADAGCFAAALAAVRAWGGVLEHPRGSAAWRAFGLLTPPTGGGWVAADGLGGWTCCVEQGHYGHRARKATWLYACGVASLPSLRWGPSARPAPSLPAWVRRPQKGATPEQRAARRAYLAKHARQTGKVWCCPEGLNKSERAADAHRLPLGALAVLDDRAPPFRPKRRRAPTRRATSRQPARHHEALL
jgi:hypothetical protein